MDNQHAFEIMVTGLSARGWTRAIDRESGECVYRTRAGVPCAVGLLIPNDRYTEDIEGQDPMDVLAMCGVEHSCSQIFLIDAQREHDVGCTPTEMRRRFQTVARNYNLTWPEGVE